jgi:FAD/FMN-containing dehydrogenase
MPDTQSATHAEALRAELTGAVVASGDDNWDLARQAFNLTVDQRPALVVQPADAEDVARTVRYAAAHGLHVAPQRTGHCAGPFDSLDDTLLLNTAALDAVSIDAGTRIARVGAGALWRDVVPAASELGLAALHGSSPYVGIVGYTLGGGLGWYVRKHGAAANRVTAIELVTADGALVRTDAEHDPELFWALRGGGGGYGVVTAMEFELLPIAEVYAGVLFFPLERAGEVLEAWRAWTATVPEEVSSVGRLLQIPPFPEIPEPLRGNAFAVVEAVCLLDEAAGAELLAPLRALGPAIDTFASMPPAGIAELHMDPADPAPAITRHHLLGELSAQDVEAFVAAAGPGSGSPLVSVEVRHLGGALARSQPTHGALASIGAGFIEVGVGIVPAPDAMTASLAQLDRIDEALTGCDAGSCYINFSEERHAPGEFFDDATLARLRAVKARVDPAGTIRANHDLAAD